MTYVVAVSGGVDSVVLLDMISKTVNEPVIVAHFDHGIRSDSADDARFVESLARQYGHRFISERATLGEGASEAAAREHRYVFLRKVAAQHGGRIVTAHHLDDLVETVAINAQRGTGWRGLAVFGAEIHRPLIDTSKASLLQYAAQHGLSWREDSTNASDAYLRNRIRKHTSQLPLDTKRQLRALHAEQSRLRHSIEVEARRLVGPGPTYSRYVLTHVPPAVAVECLRYITNGRLTRPQLLRALHAIKTVAAGSRYEAGNSISLQFSTRHFTL